MPVKSSYKGILAYIAHKFSLLVQRSYHLKQAKNPLAKGFVFPLLIKLHWDFPNIIVLVRVFFFSLLHS